MPLNGIAYAPNCVLHSLLLHSQTSSNPPNPDAATSAKLLCRSIQVTRVVGSCKDQKAHSEHDLEVPERNLAPIEATPRANLTQCNNETAQRARRAGHDNRARSIAQQNTKLGVVRQMPAHAREMFIEHGNREASKGRRDAFTAFYRILHDIVLNSENREHRLARCVEPYEPLECYCKRIGQGREVDLCSRDDGEKDALRITVGAFDAITELARGGRRHCTRQTIRYCNS